MTAIKTVKVLTFTLLALAAAAWVATFLWLLSTKDLLNHPLSRVPVYPIACTTRGCVTSETLLKYHQHALAFSAASLIDAPSLEKSLTTVVRRHLAAQAFLQSPVTATNAQKYREEILNIRSEEQTLAAVNMSLADYDSSVIIPFLQQEALREQHKVESTEELYGILSSQRPVILLPFHYSWNKQTGEAVAK